MTAGLFLVFAACLSWWYRLGTIAEGKNGCMGRREGGREARWGKWKFWSQRTRESSRWKSEVCCPSLWWMVVSLCLFWALSLSFQKALPMGLLCDLGWTWVSSEVFAFDFTRSPGITTSLGALFMFFYLCGGSWTTQGWWTWTLYPCEGSSMVVIGGDIYIPLARPHKKKTPQFLCAGWQKFSLFTFSLRVYVSLCGPGFAMVSVPISSLRWPRLRFLSPPGLENRVCHSV